MEFSCNKTNTITRFVFILSVLISLVDVTCQFKLPNSNECHIMPVIQLTTSILLTLIVREVAKLVKNKKGFTTDTQS